MLAIDRLAREHCGKRPCGRDTKRVHRFADQVFTQHRAERGAAVACAGKRRGPRALELNVAAPAVAVDHLAQEQRPPIAELRREAAELVPSVGLSQRQRSLGCLIAGKDSRALFGIESVGVEPQFLGQLAIEFNQLRPRHLRRLPGHVEALKFARIAVVESEAAGASVVWNMHHRTIYHEDFTLNRLGRAATGNV